MADSSPKLELPKPKAPRRTPGVGPTKGATSSELPIGELASSELPKPGAGQADAALAVGARPDITQLVVDHHEVLFRYAYRLTGSVPDAEDLTQQTFLVAHEKLGQVRQADSVRGWLFTVLRNGYLKNFRRTVPMTATSLGFDLDTVTAKADDRPLDGERLQQVLAELADEFKIVVLLFYFEQRSYREIAEILQVPIGTVMSRLSRGKAHLRSKLFPSGGDTSGSDTSDRDTEKSDIEKSNTVKSNTDKRDIGKSDPGKSGKVTTHA